MSITAKIVGVGVSKLKRSLKSLIKFGLDLQHQQLQQKEFIISIPEPCSAEITAGSKKGFKEKPEELFKTQRGGTEGHNRTRTTRATSRSSQKPSSTMS